MPLDQIPAELRTSSVVDLLRSIEAERNWSDLPILADALRDAGCEDEEWLWPFMERDWRPVILMPWENMIPLDAADDPSLSGCIRVLYASIYDVTARVEPPQGMLLGLHDNWHVSPDTWSLEEDLEYPMGFKVTCERGILHALELQQHGTYRRIPGPNRLAVIGGKWFEFSCPNGAVSLNAWFSLTPVPKPIRGKFLPSASDRKAGTVITVAPRGIGPIGVS